MTQNIGRQDAEAPRFCITVDHQTMNDNTVTVRHRDSMEQERVSISDLENFIRKSTQF